MTTVENCQEQADERRVVVVGRGQNRFETEGSLRAASYVPHVTHAKSPQGRMLVLRLGLSRWGGLGKFGEREASQNASG